MSIRGITPTREYTLEKDGVVVKTFKKQQYNQFLDYLIKHQDLSPVRITAYGRKEDMHFEVKNGTISFSKFQVKQSIRKARSYKDDEACHRCGATFSQRCRTPGGRPTRLPHIERREKP